MSFLDHIRRCNTHDLSGFTPWFIGDVKVGYVTRTLAGRLRDHGDVFEASGGRVRLRDAIATPEDRTEAVEGVLESLRADGLGGSRRLEPYAVSGVAGGAALMTIDRGAASAFGILSTGFHLNGTVGAGAERRMWVARRALDKMTFPGKLDNMVAGGQPATISVAQNVLKECREEADIPEALAALARPAGLISYTMGVTDGLRRHVMYVYDLDLPEAFQPHPLDGEVESFRLMPVGEVADIVRSDLDAFKFNCSLVVIDYLIRHGAIAPDHPAYFELVTGLRGAIA